MKLHENSLLQVHPHEILMPGEGGGVCVCVGLFILRSVTCGSKCDAGLCLPEGGWPTDLGRSWGWWRCCWAAAARLSATLWTRRWGEPEPRSWCSQRFPPRCKPQRRRWFLEHLIIRKEKKKKRVSCDLQAKHGTVAGEGREEDTHSGPPGVQLARPLRWRCVLCRGTDPHPCTWRTSGWGTTRERHSSPPHFHPDSRGEWIFRLKNSPHKNPKTRRSLHIHICGAQTPGGKKEK